MKFVHTADLHSDVERYGPTDPVSGLPGRVTDLFGLLDGLVDRAIAERCAVAFFVGDLFHNPSPSTTLLRELAHRFRRLTDAGIVAILDLGNHDATASIGRASGISPFRDLAMPGVFVFEDVSLETIPTRDGPLQVLAVPWVVPQRIFTREELAGLTAERVQTMATDYVRTTVTALREQLDPEVPCVALAHATVAGAMAGSEEVLWKGRMGWVLPDGVFDDRRIGYVALGHIHGYQQVGFQPPMVYSGSLNRVDWSEEGHTKGYVLGDVRAGADATFKFVEVPTRPYRTITLDVVGFELPMAEALRQLAAVDVAGAVVKVRTRCTTDQVARINEQELRKALAGAYHIAAMRKEVIDAQRDIAPGAAVTSELDPIEAIGRYLDRAGAAAEEKARVLALAREKLDGLETTRATETA